MKKRTHDPLVAYSAEIKELRDAVSGRSGGKGQRPLSSVGRTE